MSKYGKSQAELIKTCAAEHGVSSRSVRNWREAGDQRWLDFLAARAIAAPAPVQAVAATPEVPDGTGLEFEIRRCRHECVHLAHRISIAITKCDTDTEAVLSRILNDKRQTLRQLEKDTPAVLESAGDTVPRDRVLHYAAGISARLTSLPARIVTLLPEEVGPALRDQVEAECHAILRDCAELAL